MDRHFFKIPASQQSVATVAANGAYAMVCATGASHVRVRASAFTSGTITVALRAGQAREVPSLYAGSAGSAVPPVSALVGGSDGANPRTFATDTSGPSALAR